MYVLIKNNLLHQQYKIPGKFITITLWAAVHSTCMHLILHVYVHLVFNTVVINLIFSGEDLQKQLPTQREVVSRDLTEHSVQVWLF